MPKIIKWQRLEETLEKRSGGRCGFNHATPFGFVQLAIIITKLAEVAFLVGLLHVIDDGPDGGVAERLERKDAERLLDLDAKLLDAEEEDGEERRRRDRRPVVPGPPRNSSNFSKIFTNSCIAFFSGTGTD